MTRFTVVTGDFVRTGGMDVANFNLAQHLARTGMEVHLVAHRVDPALLAMPEVIWHRVAKPLNSYLLGSYLLSRAGARRGHGSRVVVNGGNCVSDDTNWVHYVHAGHQPPISASPARRLAANWIHRRFVAEERTALRRARVVIANSDRTGRELVDSVGVARDRVHTVYYGADAAYHRPPTGGERAAARIALGWHDDRPSVAFVGALGDRRKGFDVLFAAWERLCRGEPWDARLVVVGAGRELAFWRDRATAAGLASRIQFTGFTRDVRSVLWACDAIVAPARYEAYGLAVHEAVCCGLPAIVNADAGVAERLHGLEALQPSRAGDAEALVETLLRWRDGNETWKRQAAVVSAELRAWSWDDMGARIVRLMGAAA